MRECLVPYLCCPETGSELSLVSEKLSDTGEIVKGKLINSEGKVYPIVNGIPRFGEFTDNLLEMQTVEAFGRQWAYFKNFKHYMNSKELFFEFIYPINEQQIAGRKVIELGCGGGRWLERIAECRAEMVVGLDMSNSVEQAFERTRKYKNIEIIQGNILKPPLKRAFDLGISIGVVHHLPYPAKGLASALKVIKSEGNLAVWVYSKEGNEIYLRVVGLLRKISPYIPAPLLLFLSYFLAVPVYFHAHVSNSILVKMEKKFPMENYFNLLKKLRFIDIVNVINDQLAPSLAFYPAREEVMDWVNASGGRLIDMSMRTNNSWRIHIAPRQKN